jgi:orotidine-5'-phosphate decarboxylase
MPALVPTPLRPLTRPAADARLICALDLPTVAAAEALVAGLGDAVSFYKIGLELLATGGMGLAATLKARGHKIFLDWKLHDIGETVRRAASAIAAAEVCDLLTVHAEPQVMRAAVQGRAGRNAMKILGVTVLTSLNEDDLRELGYHQSVHALVAQRIAQALECEIDGVVASPHEAALARQIADDNGRPDFLIVTPGVRPAWSARNDQARAATPADALKAGASHLVCGRPITSAQDPRAAALAIVAEMAGG